MPGVEIKKVLVIFVCIVMGGMLYAETTNISAKAAWTEWRNAQPDYSTRGAVEAEYCRPQNPALTKWTDRLIPLPKEISVNGSDHATAGQVALGPMATTIPELVGASNIISRFARGVCGKADITIVMVLTGDADAQISSAIKARLAKIPRNKDQAYAIESRGSWWSRKRNIIVAANQPVGLVYAARTLALLVRPVTNETGATSLEIPRVSIVDWPDLRERTFPGCGGASFTEWLAQWKINAFQLEVKSPKINAQGEFDNIALPINVVTGQWVRTGAEWGMNIVPYLGHVKAAMDVGLLKDHRAQVAASRFKGVLPVSSGTNSGRGYCPSSPATRELLATWISQMAKISAGYGNEISVWLTEGDPPVCYCATCRGLLAGGKDVYEIETESILSAFTGVKKQYPRLRMQLVLTQGSFKVNDRIADMVMAGPPDIGLSYYEGGRTYCSDRKPMIYPMLENFARSGRELGVYPQLVNSWRTVFPFTAPQLVRFRCQEFADKRLNSIAGYFVPTQRSYFAFNMMAMAEWSWNAHGRTPAEFARAYAAVTGIADPELFARWAIKAGEAGWSLAQSRLVYALISNPNVLAKVDALVKADKTRQYLYELSHIEKMNDLPEALADARAALALAHQAGEPRMLIESECTLAELEIYEALTAVVKPLGLNKPLDPATRDVVRERLNTIDRCAHIVRVNLWRWDDIVKTENNIPLGASAYHRLIETAITPLCMSDYLWEKAVQLNIPDPRPESRFVPLRQWSAADFAATNQPVIRCDLSDRVPRAGGEYHVCFGWVPGGNVNARFVKIALMTGKKGAVEKCIRTTVMQFPFLLTPNIEWRVSIPARGAGDTLALLIELKGEQGQDSRGRIGLRRCWEQGRSPWDK